jgi:hypothetical protein
MARRQRSDSVATAVAVAQRSAAPVSPPSYVPLDDADMPFFASVIDEFPRSEWTAHQLELAAMLARTMADMAREQALLRTEGGVSFSEKGTPVVNPRKAIVQMHAGTILAMRRSLSLNARQQGQKPSEVARRRESAREVEAAFTEDGDGLLN